MGNHKDYCINCGADLSVQRLSACCANPRLDYGYKDASRQLNRMKDDGTIPTKEPRAEKEMSK